MLAFKPLRVVNLHVSCAVYIKFYLEIDNSSDRVVPRLAIICILIHPAVIFTYYVIKTTAKSCEEQDGSKQKFV